MPIYEFKCGNCNTEFERWVRGFDTSGVACPSCQSTSVQKLFSPPGMIRTDVEPSPKDERRAKDEEVRYYEKRKDYLRAAKAAERAGQQEWQVKDLLQKAGKNPYGI